MPMTLASAGPSGELVESDAPDRHIVGWNIILYQTFHSFDNAGMEKNYRLKLKGPG